MYMSGVGLAGHDQNFAGFQTALVHQSEKFVECRFRQLEQTLLTQQLFNMMFHKMRNYNRNGVFSNFRV